jgi:hypothetical protein
VNFHKGDYEKDDQGRYRLREVTAYRTAFSLSLGRILFAASVGLPIGSVLHCIFWAFVLARERKSRLAALPERGSQLPRTFYPNPTSEWIVWTIFFGIGAFVASLTAVFSAESGFFSSTMVWAVYITLAGGAALGLIIGYFTRRFLLTVRVDNDGFSYAKGRSDLQWQRANWGEILLLREMSRTSRGSTRYWLEIQFRDHRKKLKVSDDIEDYPILRQFLLSVFSAPQQT